MAEEGQVVPEVNELAADAVPAEGVTTTPADQVVSGDESQSDKPAKTFSQEELEAELGKRLAKAERKAARERDRAVAEALSKAPKAAPVVPEAPRPEQFQTTEEYVKAVAKHAIIEDKASVPAAETKPQLPSEIDHQYAEVLATGADKYEDFDYAMYVVTHLPIPDNVALAIRDAVAESDRGDDLLYYLGKHKDEALALKDLSPARALVALGKIESKLPALAAPAAKKTSSAPEPISPIRAATGSATFTNLDDERALKSLGTSGLIEAWRKRDAEARKSR
jgi:hypothetical protein